MRCALWAGESFGQSYGHAQTLWSHAQPIIVGTLVEAYALLGVDCHSNCPIDVVLVEGKCVAPDFLAIAIDREPKGLVQNKRIEE